MSERISPTTAAVSAQALTLVSREFRSRQQAADRNQSSVRLVARAASQTQTDLPRQRLDRLPQSNKPASTLVIPSDAINPPPPRTQRATRIGVVTSASRQKTIGVTVSYQIRHPKYGKYLRRKSVLHAHDEKGEAKVGDTVEADGVNLKVEAMDGLRIARLSLRHPKPEKNTD